MEPFGVVGRSSLQPPADVRRRQDRGAADRGNTVIVKPSEHTSTSACASRARGGVLPPGVFNVITGLGNELATQS